MERYNRGNEPKIRQPVRYKRGQTKQHFPLTSFDQYYVRVRYNRGNEPKVDCQYAISVDVITVEILQRKRRNFSEGLKWVRYNRGTL